MCAFRPLPPGCQWLRGADTGHAASVAQGVDYNHEDLVGNMWVNPGEIAGNGVDDDGNGLVDDVYGANYYANNGNPMDDNSHGTHCAGTIGAVGNNNIGVVGVNQNVKIMGCKFMSSSGSGSISNALKCVEYAIAKGAHVTSNSWGGGGYSSSFAAVLNAAQAAGQLFVAAAGNNNQNIDSYNSYPAGYAHDIVMSVGSSTNTDSRSSFSNYVRKP